jgi:hypothetical protein
MTFGTEDTGNSEGGLTLDYMDIRPHNALQRSSVPVEIIPR